MAVEHLKNEELLYVLRQVFQILLFVLSQCLSVCLRSISIGLVIEKIIPYGSNRKILV